MRAFVHVFVPISQETGEGEWPKWCIVIPDKKSILLVQANPSAKFSPSQSDFSEIYRKTLKKIITILAWRWSLRAFQTETRFCDRSQKHVLIVYAFIPTRVKNNPTYCGKILLKQLWCITQLTANKNTSAEVTQRPKGMLGHKIMKKYGHDILCNLAFFFCCNTVDNNCFQYRKFWIQTCKFQQLFRRFGPLNYSSVLKQEHCINCCTQ